LLPDAGCDTVVVAGSGRESDLGTWEEGSAMLASVLAAAVVVVVVVLAYVTDVLAAQERVQVWRLARAGRSRGAHQRNRNSRRS